MLILHTRRVLRWYTGCSRMLRTALRLAPLPGLRSRCLATHETAGSLRPVLFTTWCLPTGERRCVASGCRSNRVVPRLARSRRPDLLVTRRLSTGEWCCLSLGFAYRRGTAPLLGCLRSGMLAARRLATGEWCCRARGFACRRGMAPLLARCLRSRRSTDRCLSADRRCVAGEFPCWRLGGRSAPLLAGCLRSWLLGARRLSTGGSALLDRSDRGVLLLGRRLRLPFRSRLRRGVGG